MQKEVETNIFIRPIMLKKKKHDFSAWLEYRKSLKYCKKTSPSFEVMWAISDFIDLLRYMYCHGYTESDDLHLFSGTNPKNAPRNKCRCIIYHTDRFTISYMLMVKENGNEITIEISRSVQGARPEKEYFSFMDGEYEMKDNYDYQKIQFVVACLMSGVVELLKYYYKNKIF